MVATFALQELLGGGSGYLASLLVLLTSVCVYLHIRAFSFWSSRGIRGPRPWPIFGTNIYYLLGNKLDVDLKWRRVYGRTYGLYEGYSPLLRTTDNELIKQIYVKRFSSFTNRHNRFIQHPVLRNWLLWSEGEAWANQRALVSPMFSSARMRNMLAAMSACVDRFLEHSQKRLAQQGEVEREREKDGNSRSGQVSEIFKKRDLSNMTLDVIASTFFGLKLDVYSDHSRQNAFLAAAIEFARFNLAHFFAWVLMPRQLARLLTFDLFPVKNIQYFDELTKRIIEERRRSRGAAREEEKKGAAAAATASGSKDFVQLFLEAKLPDTSGNYEKVFSAEDDKEAHYNDDCKHEQLEKIQREQAKGARLFKNFSDLEIRGQMTFMFVAGFETTATTLSTCIRELGHQPESQVRLYAELRETFGADLLANFTKLNAPINDLDELYSKLTSLTLLDAFVSEALRLHSPILDHTRCCTESVELMISDGDGTPAGGAQRSLKLPRGTPISTNGYVVQRDPDYFEQANEFKLERFLPGNRDKIKSCTFIPFGVGPRHCAGMRFALLEVKLALAKIIASYTIELGPNALAYPPKLERNPVFLILQNSDFKLVPRGGH